MKAPTDCPGCQAGPQPHVSPVPELRVPVKLDGAGVAPQVARPPRPRHGQRVGSVEHGVRAEAPHLDTHTVMST